MPSLPSSFYIVAALALLLLNGCVTTQPSYRTHPEFANRMANLQNPVAAPADISISRIGAGGVPEEIDEYSEEATRLFGVSLGNSASRGDSRSWSTIEVSPSNQEEFDEALQLAKTVFSDIIAFSYHGLYPGFEHKRRDFRYSVGDLSSLLDERQADALLFIYGADFFATTGRKALNGMLTVLSAAATGTAYIGMDGSGYVCAMLVGRDGEILWIDQLFDATLDLRKPEDIDRVTATILASLKAAEQQPTQPLK